MTETTLDRCKSMLERVAGEKIEFVHVDGKTAKKRAKRTVKEAIKKVAKKARARKR